MSTTTPNLGLEILEIGEAPGTWGVPLNANWNKTDVLAGEVIGARGAYPNVDTRLDTSEAEIELARGTTASLNTRLSTVINADGTLNTGALPIATNVVKGITALSVAAAVAGSPIAVGTNDTRMLTQPQKDGLTLGANTTLHTHNLANGATDVTASAAEINQALDGISGNVTFTNLNALCGRTFYASDSLIGLVRLSVAPAVASSPISVGTNDPRMFTQLQHDNLVSGNPITEHKHLLVNGASDVTVAVADLNRALTGAGLSVTAANLTQFTDRTAYSTTTVPGLVKLSVTAASPTDPIVVGTNDTRMLNQTQKDELTSSGLTHIHKHHLVDIIDVSTSATVINRLNGAGSNVTATNLDTLTGGGATNLHHHDSRYYTETEVDAQNTALENYADAAVAAHNNSAVAHQGDNLELGDITAESVSLEEAGQVLTAQAHLSDAANTVKVRVKNSSGVDKFTVDASGNIVCQDITVQGTQTVVNTQTVNQDAVFTQDLQVDGNSILGNDDAVDTLTVNCVTSTFNGDLVIDGGITINGSVDGVDVSALNAEVVDARTSVTAVAYGNVSARIDVTETGLAAVVAEVAAARNGEANLDDYIDILRTDIDAAELILEDARGSFGSIDARFDSAEADVAAVENEISVARGGELNLDARLDTMTAATTTNTNEIVAGRNGNASLHARFNLIEGVNTTQTTNIGNLTSEINAAHTSTLYGAQTNLNTRFENIEARENTRATEVQDARTSTAFNGGVAYASLDARLEALDTYVVGTNTLVDNAKTSTTYGNFANLDARIEAAEVILAARDTEVQNARTSTTYGAFGSVDARIEDLDGRVAGVISEVTNARNGQANLDAKIDLMDTATSTNTTELTNARSSAVYSASHGSLDARLEAGETAAFTTATEVTNARASAALANTYGSLDARLEAGEAISTAVQTEVTNARSSSAAAYNTTYASLDARLEASELEVVTARTSTIYGAAASLDARLEALDTVVNTTATEVVNARASATNANTYASVDARLEAIETQVNTVNTNAVKRYANSYAASTTHVVTHNLNTLDVIVAVYDDTVPATRTKIADAGITSITLDSVNQLTIVLGASTAARVVVHA